MGFGVFGKGRIYGGPTLKKFSGPWTTGMVQTRFKAARNVVGSGKIGSLEGGGVITVGLMITRWFCIDIGM